MERTVGHHCRQPNAFHVPIRARSNARAARATPKSKTSGVVGFGAVRVVKRPMHGSFASLLAAGIYIGGGVILLVLLIVLVVVLLSRRGV
jgi:hypothetical protein